MSQLRSRKPGPSAAATIREPESEDATAEKLTLTYEPKDPEYKYYGAMMIITLIAAYLRFSNLEFPSRVVFDEVHFGKFASYYLERTYFFDLHPPMAKLLIAAWGWLAGYDGHFKFDNINDDYLKHDVPYAWLRSLSAVQGTLVVPVLFLTMKTLGFSVSAALFSSVLVAFDNAQINDSRLILLDATLILAVTLTMYCYANYSKVRTQPWSVKWWFWLYATGISLSLVISTKYVGVFTYAAIGVGIAYELWILLDADRGLSMVQFTYHFAARAWALIIVPFCLYLFWFYLHFAILTKSGPGNNFMSSEFKETLEESELDVIAKSLQYGDTITIKHQDTGAFLHSHDFVYPLRYEDGRVSSHTQQVTAVKPGQHFTGDAADDENNLWIVEAPQGDKEGDGVFTQDQFRLRHVGTGGYMLTHDVASPLLSTNEEFTVGFNDDVAVGGRLYNDTLFRFRFGGKDHKARKQIKTKTSQIKVMHVATVVAMWTHDDEVLPQEWGFGHQEVSGNKKVAESNNLWTIDEIVGMSEDDPRNVHEPRPVKHIPFLKKWWELQGLMFRHNNQLSSEHPYASQPDAWPLALSGVSFWNDNENKRQIFFVGNIIGFWVQTALLAVFVGLVFADLVTRRRHVFILTNQARSRLYHTLGFLFIAWGCHYFPFFLMHRQKFLHHYLPAHVIAAMFAGGLVEFLTSNNSTLRGTHMGLRRKKNLLVSALLIIPVIWCFYFFSPLTYGNVVLPPDEVRKRQWFDIILHYNK
ncbi:hypothetical protein DIURU_004628 [Diutina rugosa]|uniref:Dolichyl-phosphate-mannose--protein mannosyltransferase n=1 Tax=Diutina rugosa TaxID=5481 RepID=A0A642UKT5_DIURU|nr:uncharacterized protein DIURU_004628 [Diutina rugosa]KAA8898608.1 hypothetical protein DIURU_004628 [Diutina rugosa]